MQGVDPTSEIFQRIQMKSVIVSSFILIADVIFDDCVTFALPSLALLEPVFSNSEFQGIWRTTKELRSTSLRFTCIVHFLWRLLLMILGIFLRKGLQISHTSQFFKFLCLFFASPSI